MRSRFTRVLPVLMACVILGLGLSQVGKAQNGPHGNYDALADACAACHRGHTAAGAGLIASTDQGNAFCYGCHDGSGVSPLAPVVSTHSNKDFAGGVEAPFELECTQCHNPHGSSNLYNIKESVQLTYTLSITTGPVILTSITGPNSFDDGTSPSSSRLCVTCHASPADPPGYSLTNHPGGANHLGGIDYTGQDCTICHPHSLDENRDTKDGFMASCLDCHGRPPDGTAYPNRAGSHTSHFTPTLIGPQIPLGLCDDCHLFSASTHNDGQVTFADGQPLATTTACDECHSPGGAFNGLDSVGGSVGARNNWYTGVYTGTGVAMTLQTGKEKWCAGCHDGAPLSASDLPSFIQGVYAPPVAGDTLGSYGFYVTGHGQNADYAVECLDCHHADRAHIDGEYRTYVVTAENYTDGYRLGENDLQIPHFSGPEYYGDVRAYELCFRCHVYDNILDSTAPYQTNFRDEVNEDTPPVNSHDRHLNAFGPNSWDSDWDMAADSHVSCPACHNVHGSSRPGGLRLGELISTPPAYSDKIPALDFVWYKADGSTITTELADSQWGNMPPLGGTGAGSIADSKVCNGCHGGNDPVVYGRSPILGLLTCVGCQRDAQDNGDSRPAGGRLAIGGQFGQDGILSHHVFTSTYPITDSIVTDDDCLVCHLQRTDTHRHMDGYVTLRDEDDLAGATYVESYPGAFRDLTISSALSDLTGFCSGCHDGDGGASLPTPTDPFGDGHSPPEVIAHSNVYGGIEDPFRVECAQCHAAHGSSNLSLIRPSVLADPALGLSSGPVVLSVITGTDSFDEADTASGIPETEAQTADDICATCHNNPGSPGYPVTSHFGGDGHGGIDHRDQDCTNCHVHERGFAHGAESGTGCIECHGHDAGTNYDADATAPYTPGATPSLGVGTYQSHSTHTETDADDAKGPAIYCSDCHDVGSFPSFNSGTDSNGDGRYDLAETDVCDVCHSPGGAFDGVEITSGGLVTDSVGAKDNWYTGVYTGTGMTATLQTGKGKWCAGCHDSVPSVIDGVPAPNVAGDEAQTWGIYVNGHDRSESVPCTDCHDATAPHADGLARTYAFDPAYYGPTESGMAYASGYRLRNIDGLVPLMIPANYNITFGYDAGLMRDTAFRMCFKCHEVSEILDNTPGDGLDSNYKASLPDPPRNYSYAWGSGADVNEHVAHIMNYVGPFADSDWDTATTGLGGSNGYDTLTACSSCHNVHGPAGTEGSTNEAMIRNGSLAGRTGYGFSYLLEDLGSGGYPLVTSTGATQSTSVGAVFRNSTATMCAGATCHGDPAPPSGNSYDATGSGWGTYLEYYRTALSRIDRSLPLPTHTLYLPVIRKPEPVQAPSPGPASVPEPAFPLRRVYLPLVARDPDHRAEP